MSKTKLAQYFLGSMIGVALYEGVVYIIEPYSPEWRILLLQAVIISLLVTVILGLFRWARCKFGAQK